MVPIKGALANVDCGTDAIFGGIGVYDFLDCLFALFDFEEVFAHYLGLGEERLDSNGEFACLSSRIGKSIIIWGVGAEETPACPAGMGVGCRREEEDDSSEEDEISDSFEGVGLSLWGGGLVAAVG